MTDPKPLPELFKCLEELLHYPDTPEGRMNAAKRLTQALREVPDLQASLSDYRQRVVQEIYLREGMTYTDISKELGVGAERVSAIARGQRSPDGRRKAR
ncbi:sigma factor-like helix-turn-helix DNA-binding protein [Streptomyces sp. NRRL S-350]|uniref:sigma factor-like helix-turn-helix DNA-binding protein n=1 Tax=Streptomyces sp. NRRL S-350 TaxID=1463902 RepID=UPI0004C032C6|nr:sigma factor-like helix-turn-helix DNA-binding protein [Streptomyces sp. NRRL S-350]